MKKKSFHIAIDEPCAEKWQNMQPNADGKFCLHCSKTVIDFTQRTSYEIKSYFQQHSENTCGRFTKLQLEETYTIYEANKFDHYKFVASLALGLLTLDTLNAFSIDGNDFKNEKDSVTLTKLIDNTKKLDSVSIIKIGEKEENLVTIKGTVLDSKSNEELIGVNIYFPNNVKYGTVTDFEGNFELDVKNVFPVKLVFSYLGYTDLVLTIYNSSDFIKVNLEQTDNITTGEVVIVGSIKKEYSINDLSICNMPTIKESIQERRKRKHKH